MMEVNKLVVHGKKSKSDDEIKLHAERQGKYRYIGLRMKRNENICAIRLSLIGDFVDKLKCSY